MSRLTSAQLAKGLAHAADILRGRLDTSQCRDVISGMLVLKRASDQPGAFHVPEAARWSRLRDDGGEQLDKAFTNALWALSECNPSVLGGVFEALDLNRTLPLVQMRLLVRHFDEISLSDDDLEFDDTLGRAYDELLGTFADGAGRGGGEFFTPRSVVDLMVRLVRPREGHSIYDPFTGSGGMLVQAGQYVTEHAGDIGGVRFFGQERNRATWATARLNLLLHGVRDASVLCGDTLADPLHSQGDGCLRRFDRILTNPPFSMSYSGKEIGHPERMTYGWTAGQSNRADLMNVQHVLATLEPDGIGAVVVPQGPLFRSGVESEIRRGIVEDARLEAVIGIGPNVFHGTALPACVLVLRGTKGTPGPQSGEVLFVNAEREVVTGRSRNHLEPRNIEKIVGVFHERTEITGFSRLVPRSEIADNDFNLNIRRYLDTDPPAQPALDVRAALFGGVPAREVETAAGKFRAFGIGLTELFRPREPGYLDFLSEGCEATAARIPALTAAREVALAAGFEAWWEAEAVVRLGDLAGTRRLLTSRGEIMASFREALLPVGVLDRYQLDGAFATWWSGQHDGLRSLDLRGFNAATTCRAALPDTANAVLGVLRQQLGVEVEKLVFAERQALVDRYLDWGERYQTSLMDLERQNEEAGERLRLRFQELGYA